jgi:hypothetical protein
MKIKNFEANVLVSGLKFYLKKIIRKNQFDSAQKRQK